ncbi:MAG TPA: glucosamine-6-phosphate deaminase [Planctomycetota bacterium]|nr:glucosamine-6-phosphate deaminase [Planctomycetota bacterium]
MRRSIAGRLEVVLVEDAVPAARILAREIAELVRGRGERTVVLGLAAGRTPVPLYRELVRMRHEEGLALDEATLVQLDEYLELPAGHPASFSSFLRRELLEPAGIPAERLIAPPCDAAEGERELACAAIEHAIRAAGGIDLQILGIGLNGHLGFNEPGSHRDSRTRVVELDEETRRHAARDFGSIEDVPRKAITLGLGTILDARRVRALAFGAEKADVVHRMLGEDVGPALPASFLREHGDAMLVVDGDAAPW